MFWISPFLAIFSRDFYQRMSKASLRLGLGYWFYLATLMTVITGASLSVRLLPEMDQFVFWLKGEMPVLIWHPEGLSLQNKTSFSLVHPKYGPLVQFDMTKTEVRLEDMGDNSIFVTSKKVFIRQPGRLDLRAYDLTQLEESKQKKSRVSKRPSSFQIKPENIVTAYRQFKPWLVVGAGGLIWGGFLVWKLLAGLFYSWIGLLLNLMRRDKLDYSHLLTLAFFAMTPASVIQLLQLVFPVFEVLPFGFLGSAVVTIGYLYFAIIKTEPPELPPNLQAVS